MLDWLFLGQQAGIEFIALAQAQGTLSATVTINKPTGTLEGDLLLAILFTSDDNTMTLPSGWTQAALSSGQSPTVLIAYKTAGASEPSTYTFTSNKAPRISGTIFTYRGAAFDVVGTNTFTSSTTQTASSITLSTSGSTIFAAFGAAATSRTWSSPTSGLVSAATDSDGTSPSYAIYKQDVVASGSTGSKSATMSGTSVNSNSILVGIKPA